MPQNRTLLALVAATAVLPLWAAAQGPAPGPAQAPPVAPAVLPTAEVKTPTEAEKTLDEAIARVKSIESISADVKQDVKMLGQKFRVEGKYLRAPQYRVYLLLEVIGLGDVGGTLLQVCDGVTSWEYRRVLEERPSLNKRTLAPVLEKLNSPECDATLRSDVLASLGFSGPEALLDGLRKAVAFDQKAEGEVEGKKAWILRGRWIDRTSLTGPEQPPMPLTGALPSYVPSIVTVYLGQEDGWPYRVELRGRSPSIMEMRKETRELGPDGRPIGRVTRTPDVAPTEITLTYGKVELNPKLGPEQFAFQPPNDPNLRVVDETATITEYLTAALTQRAAQRKAEAAKEGASLPRPIEVPKPPADSNPAAPPVSETTPAAPAIPK